MWTDTKQQMTDKFRGGGAADRHPQVWGLNMQASLHESIPPENNCIFVDHMCTNTKQPITD